MGTLVSRSHTSPAHSCSSQTASRTHYTVYSVPLVDVHGQSLAGRRRHPCTHKPGASPLPAHRHRLHLSGLRGALSVPRLCPAQRASSPPGSHASSTRSLAVRAHSLGNRVFPALLRGLESYSHTGQLLCETRHLRGDALLGSCMCLHSPRSTYHLR